MQTYNIHDAKTHLSRLVEQAALGESFVIAKADKPMIKVMALDAPEPAQKRRVGFLSEQFKNGQFKVPDDFDTMCADEILELFGIDK
ncbi:antitoxin [Betaproteobacteria bacterium]|nr:antitoxin [Betaproteobacteria bacterium]GHU39896.1 antitoxin [Betaproteobacteria bacterium]